MAAPAAWRSPAVDSRAPASARSMRAMSAACSVFSCSATPTRLAISLSRRTTSSSSASRVPRLSCVVSARTSWIAVSTARRVDATASAKPSRICSWSWRNSDTASAETSLAWRAASSAAARASASVRAMAPSRLSNSLARKEAAASARRATSSATVTCASRRSRTLSMAWRLSSDSRSARSSCPPSASPATRKCSSASLTRSALSPETASASSMRAESPSTERSIVETARSRPVTASCIRRSIDSIRCARLERSPRAGSVTRQSSSPPSP